MKNILMFGMALFATTVLFSQNVTVSQLIELSDKSLGEVEENLSQNNWFFFQGLDETEKKYGNAKFVYDRPNLQAGDTAEYFLTYYFSEADKAKAIEFSHRNKALYDVFMEQLTNLKFKLIDSKTKNGHIVKVFKRKGIIIEITIPPNMTGLNVYKFLFAKKSSYRKIE